MSSQPGERPWALVVFYLLFFMAVGVALPYLPGYYQSLGFKGAQIGTLLAIAPAFALVMPPLWGQLADRTGRPGAVLLVATAGGVAGYAVLAQARTFPAAVAGCALQAAFASSITPLADTLALHHVQRHGGSYARIRTFGSLGFVLASLPFGFLVTTIDRTAVLAPALLLGLASAWVAGTLARAPRVEHHGPGPTVASALALLRRPDVFLFLAAGALHWVACAPYHGSLAPHVIALGLPPSVVGVSSSVGVLAELLVMVTWSRWGERAEPRRLLLISFGVSAGRWAVMALTSSPAVLVAVAVLHGLTFGAFYLAAVAWMAQRTPASLRATGQSLFAAATFGVGGIIGYRGAGELFDLLGGHRLFAVAAGLELLPALALLLVPRRAAE